MQRDYTDDEEDSEAYSSDDYDAVRGWSRPRRRRNKRRRSEPISLLTTTMTAAAVTDGERPGQVLVMVSNDCDHRQAVKVARSSRPSAPAEVASSTAPRHPLENRFFWISGIGDDITKYQLASLFAVDGVQVIDSRV